MPKTLLYLRAMTIYFLRGENLWRQLHSSIPIVPLSWPKTFDANRDFENNTGRCYASSLGELAKTVASTWHEIVKLGGFSHRVIIRLLTCAKTYSAPKEVKLSVKNSSVEFGKNHSALVKYTGRFYL